MTKHSARWVFSDRMLPIQENLLSPVASAESLQGILVTPGDGPRSKIGSVKSRFVQHDTPSRVKSSLDIAITALTILETPLSTPQKVIPPEP